MNYLLIFSNLNKLKDVSNYNYMHVIIDRDLKSSKMKFCNCILQKLIYVSYYMHLINSSYKISFNVLNHKVKLYLFIDILFKMMHAVLI